MVTPSVILEILASALLFIFFWKVIGERIFRPYFLLLEEREAQTSGARERTVSSKEKAQDMLAELEHELRASRVEGLRVRDDLISQAKKEYAQKISEAMEHSAGELAQARNESNTALSEALKQVPAESEKLASEVVSRLISQGSRAVLH